MIGMAKQTAVDMLGKGPERDTLAL